MTRSTDTTVGAVGAGHSGVWFAMPWLIGLVVLALVPLVGSLLMSLTCWDGLALADNIEWVGLANYCELAGDDPRFHQALLNSMYYSLAVTPLQLIASLVVAVLLSQRLRGMAFYRTLFYLPHVLGGVATVLIWSWLFNPRFGPVNAVLGWLLAAVDPLVRLVDDRGSVSYTHLTLPTN